MDNDQLELLVERFAASIEGQSRDQFELNLEWDSSLVIDESGSIVVYFSNGVPCGWYNNLNSRAGYIKV
jgi:hypothetical protein